MKLQQLRCFAAVARTGSFTAAASELLTAQPAVSASIGRLERELGGRLFERTTRAVALTPLGHDVLPHALAALEAIARATDATARPAPGPLRIGVTYLTGPVDLPGLLATHRERWPASTVTVRAGLVADLLALLDDGDIDLVLAPLHGDLDPQYSTTLLAEDSTVLGTPPGWKVPSPVRLADLREQPFVSLSSAGGLTRIVTTACEAVGFAPNVVVEAPTPQLARAFVAGGLGVAILARSLLIEPGPPVDVHELADAPGHPPFGAITRRDRPKPPPVRDLLDRAEDVVEQPPLSRI